MSPRRRGVYEQLVTRLLEQALANNEAGAAEVDSLRNAEAADRIALHVSSVLKRAIEDAPEEDQAELGATVARQLLALIAQAKKDAVLEEESPVEPPTVLRSIRARRPDNSFEEIPRPLIPLLDTTLLTNAPGEPRVGHQINTEIASADRIDVIMAFIRRSGINPLLPALRRHVEGGGRLRVLTTIYTGSTEGEALEALQKIGAEVRVSYDTSSTRLHAKAWVFHRDSGFSTAYVGSSNLTQTAQVSGLEWNVRLSGARNPDVIGKVAAVFDSYWEQPDFEPFEREAFSKALQRTTSTPDAIISPIEVRLWPFQERLLEQIELAREQGHHRNLLVAATGTGKTVMAAVDYARLKERLPRARLLFVAHREEILSQSRATFAHALRDGAFGEMWVGGERPTRFEHVFASIQSLNASGINAIDPKHFDVVVVDEFHHAAAASYEGLLRRLEPVELLGLTATPERSDNLSVLTWFDGRIAAELRLWDAIDQHRLVPFSYYGIADNLDLREIPFKRSTGYDIDGLTKAITASDVWARAVVKQFRDHLDQGAMALGFCVSVDHARYMARVFNESGIKATAVWANSPDEERRKALTDLAARRLSVVFSVDLFNEGLDVPAVNALLMLRPTESPLLFLQQLGRGLRRADGKDLCTVLDFVGQHNREFRYDRRFQALLGGSRKHVERQVAEGFPFLPAGCSMQLDPVASERVLASIRYALPDRWPDKARELKQLAATNPAITLAQFLTDSGLDLLDVYDKKRGWYDLKHAAEIGQPPADDIEEGMRRAIGRLLHVDDRGRLDTWRAWLRHATPPNEAAMDIRQRRHLHMLLVQLIDSPPKTMALAAGAELLWKYAALKREIVELLDVLEGRQEHASIPLVELSDVPLVVHARYTRNEMLAAAGDATIVKVREWREGAFSHADLKADFFAFTLDKTSGQFSPTTRYKDYAISRELVHWESQSTTRAESPTGRRYQTHAATGNHILLFARLTSDERASVFLGPAKYVSHVGERPMAITWRLTHPLPGDLFQQFAAAVA